jgi:ketosteroid isomerase-like protein
MTIRDEAAREVVELHERWFAAAAAKDLEASMQPISAEIVSFEHSAPLQFTDLEAIRGECQRGFDLASDEFSWTVPDLRVHVRDDLAVAWGLNRMASRLPDGTEQVTWSRGTRVFLRNDEGWLMVHQHVSFPVDPETGAAATDLTP